MGVENSSHVLYLNTFLKYTVQIQNIAISGYFCVQRNGMCNRQAALFKRAVLAGARSAAGWAPPRSARPGGIGRDPAPAQAPPTPNYLERVARAVSSLGCLGKFRSSQTDTQRENLGLSRRSKPRMEIVEDGR